MYHTRDLQKNTDEMGNPRADFKNENTSSKTYLTWGIKGTFQPIL